MTPPSRLYKYQPVSEKSMTNLREDQIWFSKPSHFNDPFDCAIRLGTLEMSEEQVMRLYPYLREMSDGADDFDAEYLSDAKPNSQFKDAVIRGANKFFDSHRELMLHERGVACFSEVKDNLLLWSHYAHSHHGFCLEFDGTCFPFNMARKVDYSETIPSINPASVLFNEEHVLFPMILTKADCWAYEQEWRIFHTKGNVAHRYSANCLLGIYFGENMKLEHRFEIINLLKDSPTRTYEMSKSESEYRLTYKEICLAR